MSRLVRASGLRPLVEAYRWKLLLWSIQDVTGALSLHTDWMEAERMLSMGDLGPEACLNGHRKRRESAARPQTISPNISFQLRQPSLRGHQTCSRLIEERLTTNGDVTADIQICQADTLSAPSSAMVFMHPRPRAWAQPPNPDEPQNTLRTTSRHPPTTCHGKFH